MTEPINIISAILKKYNEKFDENEKAKDEIMNKNNEDFKKLLLEIDKVEQETKCVTDIKELFLTNRNIISIHEINFIQDIRLVTKIVEYRKLEIKKQIRIINLAIEVYKYVLIKIECFDFFPKYTTSQVHLTPACGIRCQPTPYAWYPEFSKMFQKLSNIF